MVRLSGLLSERPNPSTTPDGGCYYYATDEGVVYEDVGDWVVRTGVVSRRDMAGRKAGVIVDRPAAGGMVGWFYRATDEGKTYEAFPGGWAEYAPTANPTLSVATAAARKDPASYAEAVVGVTRVVQADLPDILYTLVDQDVTQDASWVGQPTVNSAGEIEGPLIARVSVSGDVPAENEIVVSTGLLAIGNNYDEQGSKMISEREAPRFAANRPGEIVIEFDQDASSNPVFGFLTTTGYCAFQRWDGVLEVKGFGFDAIKENITYTVPAVGTAWGGRTLKQIRVWASDVNGVPTGAFNSADGNGSLLGGNSMPIHGFHMEGTEVAYLNFYSAFQGKVFSVRGCETLTKIYFESAPNLEYFALGNNSALTDIVLRDSLVTSFDTSQTPNLEVLALDDSPIRVIDIGFATLTYFSANDADLYSVSAVGVGGAWGVTPLKLNGNNLTTDEVYKFVSEASAFDASVDVELEGNPCESGGTMIDGATRTAVETIALATSKNWNLVFVRS